MDMQEQQKRSPITLFYSYVDQDENLREELEKHLSILKRQGFIVGWGHHKILAGTDKSQINEEQFFLAQIILLLISPDFLNEDTSYVEMEQALKLHNDGLASVIPLLLRPVDLLPASLAHLQALPYNGIPVKKWENLDEAFVNIAKDIRLVIEQWNDSSSKLSPQSSALVLSSPFLYSAQKDLLLLESLEEDLQKFGVMMEKDRQASQSSSSDKDEKEALREAIRSASVVILIVSSSTWSSSSVDKALGIVEIYERPLYLFWMEGNYVKEVTLTRYKYLFSFDARGERYSQALQELVKALGGQTSFTSSQTSLSKQLISFGPPRNPYKGLEAFHEEDAQDFFGRDDLIEALLKKVQQLLSMNQQNQSASRLLTILGLSGSGKSSLVMAGLIPKLKQGGVSGSKHWTYLPPMVPGKRPLETLALSLAELFPLRSPNDIRDKDLKGDSGRGLHVLLKMYSKTSNARILLVIDQFEELLTQTATEDERRHFLELLLTAVTEPDGPLITIITLRADFYGQPSWYPEFEHLIEEHHIVCKLLNMKDWRAVIEGPAQLPDVRLMFEEGLVGDLLFEVQNQAGALPLLQFTLHQLFQRRQGRLLTVDAYHQIKGVKGALAQYAEKIYKSLPEENQRLARALFLRLINPGTVVEDATRRRIQRSELVVMDEEETARLNDVTDTFINARLLTANTVRLKDVTDRSINARLLTANTGEEISTVEVSHEALIQVWESLQEWLYESQGSMRLQQAISAAIAEWNQHGCKADWLYRGSQLAEALKWRKDNLPSFDEDRFLQASSKESLRSTRRTFLIGALGVVGTVGAIFLFKTLLEDEAKNLPQLISPYTYNKYTNAVNSVVWSPDGKYIAAGSDDNTVQVWDASNGNSQLTYTGHESPVLSVAWSPDSRYLASASVDKTVQIWDASNGHRQFTYKGHMDYVTTVAWSPDGKYLASGSNDKTVQVWDASSGRHQFTYKGHVDYVTAVAWSPDGKRIASGSRDKTVQVWDASNGRSQFTYKGHKNIAFSVAWSPDGKRLASGSADETVQVWDSSSGRLQFTNTGHTDYVTSVAWSPDGEYLASGSNDKTVQVWNISSDRLQFTYTGHTSVVLSVVWSPDGKYLASGSDDSTVQVWDTSSNPLQLTYTGHTELINSIAWSPDGKYLASGSADSTVQVWETSTASRQSTYTGHNGVVTSIVWSPDGKYLASGSADSTVQVWDASNGKRQFTYTSHKNAVFSVAWSPDGKRIASGSRDKTVQVWNASNGHHQFTYTGHKDYVTSIAWSPDGKYLASGSDDSTVQIWDSNSGSRQFSYIGHTGYVTSIVWSPDGNRIVSGSVDGTGQVWNASNGSRQFTYISHKNAVFSVAWSPDGKRIASGSRDKTVQIWNASNGSRQFTYTGHTNTVFSVAWSPDGKRIASGSRDKTVRVWNASSR